jgi:small subunit ribosomal protein S4
MDRNSPHSTGPTRVSVTNVCLRLGLALTSSQARQLVSQGHVSIDGRLNDVPSAQVKPG